MCGSAALPPRRSIRPSPASPATSSAVRCLPSLWSRSAKSSIRAGADPEAAGIGRAKRQHRPDLVGRTHRPCRRARWPSGQPHGRSRRPTATRPGPAHRTAGRRLGATRRAARDSNTCAATRSSGELALPQMVRIAASRASRSLPMNARRSCHASVPPKLVGVGGIVGCGIEIDQRLARQHAQRGRDPRRGQALRRREHRRPRQPGLGLQARRVDQPLGRHHSGRGGQGRSASCSAGRPAPIRSSPRATSRRPRRRPCRPGPGRSRRPVRAAAPLRCRPPPAPLRPTAKRKWP